SLDLQLDPLGYRGLGRGVAAKAARANEGQNRQEVPAADRPAFLERLGSAEIRLGESKLGRQYWRELAALQPDNIRVLLGLFELALVAVEHSDAAELVKQIQELEGKLEVNNGIAGLFAQAALLIDQVRRGIP